GDIRVDERHLEPLAPACFGRAVDEEHVACRVRGEARDAADLLAGGEQGAGALEVAGVELALLERGEILASDRDPGPAEGLRGGATPDADEPHEDGLVALPGRVDDGVAPFAVALEKPHLGTAKQKIRTLVIDLEAQLAADAVRPSHLGHGDVATSHQSTMSRW